MTHENNGIPKRFSQAECGTQDEEDSRMEEISSRLRASVKTAKGKGATFGRNGSKTLSIQEIRDFESLSALEYAKEKEFWITNLYDLGNPFSSGNENTVVLNSDEGVVYKSNNLMNSKTISGLFDQITIHNQLFPETKYDLVGFTGIDKGKGKTPYIEVILKQTLLDNTTPATFEEIADYMLLLGFKKISNTSFTNGQYTLSDLYPRNVLRDSNVDLYVIDDIISEINSFDLHSPAPISGLNHP